MAPGRPTLDAVADGKVDEATWCRVVEARFVAWRTPGRGMVFLPADRGPGKDVEALVVLRVDGSRGKAMSDVGEKENLIDGDAMLQCSRQKSSAEFEKQQTVDAVVGTRMVIRGRREREEEASI